MEPYHSHDCSGLTALVARRSFRVIAEFTLQEPAVAPMSQVKLVTLEVIKSVHATPKNPPRVR